MKLAETYQTHYDFGKAFENATKGTRIMAEAGLFLEYNIRAGYTDKYLFLIITVNGIKNELNISIKMLAYLLIDIA